MQSCNYCGKENDDAATYCIGCGTSPLESHVAARGSLITPWGSVFAWVGLGIGIFGTGCAALLSYPFFHLHHDIQNGAIIWFGNLCSTGFYTFLIGLPCAIVGIIKRRRLLGWLGVVFAIAPVPLGLVMLEAAKLLNGFHVTG